MNGAVYSTEIKGFLRPEPLPGYNSTQTGLPLEDNANTVLTRQFREGRACSVYVENPVPLLAAGPGRLSACSSTASRVSGV
ncbi:hypothetical protein PoB_006912700 [Plakobranchus ocellatus]|uniref:Uncharacterized protein n=1 Tax=Plakobranchus ocellatus TaxID=259542 RepID=A0AAV4DF30_9GAST|nr:hypothetical protein PoB_006912700 [Plakobranchus ocellatus]